MTANEYLKSIQDNFDGIEKNLDKLSKKEIDTMLNALAEGEDFPEEQPTNGDIISRRAAIKYLMDNMTWYSEDGYETDEDEKKSAITSLINGVPSIQPVTGKWIPVKYRPMTDEEKKDYSDRTGYDIEDLDYMLDCQLPEDGETVLITDSLGNVEVDTFIYDSDGCYFECNCDMDDVKAWMPLPEAYTEEN